MRTSEVAAAADVNVQTLRYYERRGLLPEPARRGARYRDYDDGAIRRVRFIKRAQELGFSLDEIRELLELRERRGSAADVRQVAVVKIADIDGRMRRLAAMRGALTTLVDACECKSAPRECPIIEALDDEPRPSHALVDNSMTGESSCLA
jgi:Hg(II)-responsive transcriptional regulator